MCICFPGETTVTTKKGVKPLSELQPGDEILTIGRKSGIPKWTSFYTWGHREVAAVAEYLVLKFSTGQELKISREHLLFVDGERGRKVAKTAGQVCKGDKLFHLGNTGSVELLSVVEITAELLPGVYAPFSMSGHFLANGFLVGCYANVGQDFELAHAALAPLRVWHRIRQSPSRTHTLNQDGIHGYAQKLMEVRDYLGNGQFPAKVVASKTG